MNRLALPTLAALTLAVAAGPTLAEGGVEVWRPLSHTATGITGTIRLSPTELRVAGRRFALRVAADVPEYHADLNQVHPARILEVITPKDPMLLNHNHFCAGRKLQWLVVYHTKKDELGMSTFSVGPRPVTDDNNPNLCGTYSYFR